MKIFKECIRLNSKGFNLDGELKRRNNKYKLCEMEKKMNKEQQMAFIWLRAIGSLF